MKMIDAANATYNQWEGILIALGTNPAHLKGTNKPCPFCGGTDRYTFSNDAKGGFFCRQCGHGDGFDFLMRLHGWDLQKAMTEAVRVVGSVVPITAKKKERSDEDKAKDCRKLLEGAGRIVDGTPAYRYLLRRCGNPGAILGDLRAHPGIRHSVSGGVHPAMLAILRYADGGGSSVHRTYLTEDGQKAAVDPVRMMMPGLPLNGSSVRLGPIAERLGIAEGIETAISASKMFGLPVWAATNAGLMKTWEPPEGVKEIVIFGDSDASWTGQEAAYSLAKRLRIAGYGVDVEMPQLIGADWNDVQMGRVA